MIVSLGNIYYKSVINLFSQFLNSSIENFNQKTKWYYSKFKDDYHI